MATLSMNEVTTVQWSLEEDLERFQEAGYRGIGVWRQKVSDAEEDRAIDLLAASGLEVTNLTWAGGFTGSDGRTLEESMDDAMEAIRLAAAINARCLTVYAGGRNNHTGRHAQRLFLTAIDELLPFAEAADVPLAIEPMHPVAAADWTFFTSLESVLSLIEQYDCPHLKMAADTYHFQLHELDSLLLDRLAAKLAIVHVGDRRAAQNRDLERCPLGAGRLPLQTTLAALTAAGYCGPFDIKLTGAAGDSPDYRRLLRQSQAVFAQQVGATATSLFA